MNIKILLGILIVAFIGLFVTQKAWSSMFIQWFPEKETVVQSSSNDSKNKEEKTFESLGINPNQEKPFTNKSPIIFTSSNGVEVSFTDTLVQARNPGSHIFLNKKEIGTVEGHGILDASFSNNNQTFVFTVLDILGATSIDTNNYEIDISSGVIRLVK